MQRLSYLGEFLRFFGEELFGLACHKPNTVSWDNGGWAPCTTSPGTTSSTGGAFFNDLPVNAIGCFVMGLLVTGDTEWIAVNIPIAYVEKMAAPCSLAEDVDWCSYHSCGFRLHFPPSELCHESQLSNDGQ
jgi:hypothetical protein